MIRRAVSRRLAGALAAATVLAVLAAPAAVAAPAAPAAPGAAADAVREREYWLGEYGIEQAWATTRGEGVRIAVIDSGIDGTHRDLRGAVVDGADFSGLGSSNGQQPVGSDGSEHGTMVASLAAGRGSGASDGILGAAPEADLLALSIGFGEGRVDSDDQIAEAVRWAVDHGADVINMSLTRNTPDWPESWDDAFLYAAEHDVVVVAAAGNRGSGTDVVGAPATMPGVLVVAGVDRDENASVDASSQGITIGVAAPSEELVGALPGGGYTLWSGTSGAAPIVAGVVALVRAAHPDLDAANVINRVVETARDAGAPGVDVTFGFGLVDARAAVQDDVPVVDENPMGDLAEWIRLYRRGEATPTPVPGESAAPDPGEADGPRLAAPDLVGLATAAIPQATIVLLPMLALLVVLLVWTTFGVEAVRAVIRRRRNR